MPELPEVEVVRRGLGRWVSGRRIADVEVRHPRAVRRHGPGAADFRTRLLGRTLGSAQRRGKYLWIPLDAAGSPDEALLAHLGMSGQLLVRPSGAADEVHLRVRLRFDDGGAELRFVDQRTFGGLALAELVGEGRDAVPLPVRHIARDPLDPAFDDAAFARALRRRRSGLKRALLDQSLVSGVGNIYADEALWRARLHYDRPTETLRRPQVDAVLGAARAVMLEALGQGGTSFDALYVNVNGESGYFDRSLDAYGRVGLPCRRCGTLIVREPFMNRSSYRCPHCQRTPRRRAARLTSPTRARPADSRAGGG
jgi:formamidopyrimidine-DNA glycosylase